MLPHQSHITKYFFIALVLLILVYAYFEARNMLYGPQIFIDSREAITVTDEKIEISGQVKNVVEITLSGNPVFIDDVGVFNETRLLAEGINRFVFEAKDKFGRTKEEILEIIYTPERAPTNVGSIEE
tara:strand:- start:933 stop:1313 length:381 start_codon:yes stop_codon:yes gene_type:complete